MKSNCIGKFEISELIKEYCTPLYIVDADILKKRAVAFNSVKKLSKYNVDFAYANKALCTVAIGKILNNLGYKFDVVSAGEIAIMLKAGVPAENLIFHGNNKTLVEIEYAVKNGVGCFVVDNTSELERINSVNKLKQNILVRINPCIQAHTHKAVNTSASDSKFGFIINQKTIDIIRQISERHNFLGIHTHIGSQIFGSEPYYDAINKIVDFIKELYNLGIVVSTLDLGGGFGVTYTDADPSITNQTYINTLNDILIHLSTKCNEEKVKIKNVIFEPGRSLIANAGYTIYTIGDIKTFANGKKYIVVDGGMFESPRHALYGSNYTISSVENFDKEKNEIVSVVGKCCESGDVIVEYVKLQSVNVGQHIIVESTGAYNYSMASNYNLNLVPPILMIDGSNKEIIVRRQSMDEILSLHTLPEWLK